MNRRTMRAKWQHFFHTVSHPADGYYWIRHQEKGSLWIAFLMVILYGVAFSMNRISSSFIVNDIEPRTVNLPAELAGVILLVAGGLIYTLFRPTTLLGFRLTDAIGLSPLINNWRTALATQQPAPFIVYCLPNGLWSAAFILIMDRLFAHQPLRQRLCWTAVIPGIGIAAELLQAVGIVPGTFDWLDILCYAVPYLVYVGIIRLKSTN